jgi:hypothetical protein
MVSRTSVSGGRLRLLQPSSKSRAAYRASIAQVLICTLRHAYHFVLTFENGQVVEWVYRGLTGGGDGSSSSYL